MYPLGDEDAQILRVHNNKKTTLISGVVFSFRKAFERSEKTTFFYFNTKGNYSRAA